MDLERIQSRRNNVQSVEPLLGALRTISLGTWQVALRLLKNLEDFSEDYQYILVSLAPYLKLMQAQTTFPAAAPANTRKDLVVVAGSERGLCGRLDQDLIDFLQTSLENAADGQTHDYVVFGARMSKAISRQVLAPQRTYAAVSTAMPSFTLASQLIREWISMIALGRYQKIIVYYTSFQSITQRIPSSFQLLPHLIDLAVPAEQENWPPPVIETDPKQLFLRTYEQISALRLYEALLHTKASVHSNRYQLMEESTKNADRLLEDLDIMLQMERRQQITREMQELAIGAGLLAK
jgi:ATP synthase F1 gamma subunit